MRRRSIIGVGIFRLFGFAILYGLLVANGTTQGPVTYKNLTGVVSNAGGRPLKSAIVKIKNEHNGRIRSYITSADGRYSFRRIDDQPDYSVWATWQHLRSKTESVSHFDSDKSSQVDLVIPTQ